MITDDHITIAEAARMTGLSGSAIRRWVKDGRVNGWHIGTRCRVSKTEIASLIRFTPKKSEETPLNAQDEDIK